MWERDLGGVRVLVVEDDLDCRELFRIVLELAGATVTTATGAWEGLKLLGEVRPHVVVSDLSLPDRDGCWLIRSARAAVARDLPAMVIVTAHADDFTRTRCLFAGCDAFLGKPVDPIDLCEVVARLAPDVASLSNGVGARTAP